MKINPSTPNIIHPIVVVSDTHIQSEEDSRYHLLLAVINQIDRQRVEYFVLNGDIFDFLFGGKQYFRDKYHRLGQALTQLAQSGVKVVYMEGNHEFFLPNLDWKEVRFSAGQGFVAKMQSGHQVAFCHGDLLDPPWHYKIYQSIVRNPWFRFVLALFPGTFLQKATLEIAKLSRKKTKYVKLNTQQLEKNAFRWLSTTSAPRGIIGHYHLKKSFKNDSNQVFFLNSWDLPNYLGLDGDSAERFYLEATDEVNFTIKQQTST